jgi:hypothetical protein
MSRSFLSKIEAHSLHFPEHPRPMYLHGVDRQPNLHLLHRLMAGLTVSTQNGTVEV